MTAERTKVYFDAVQRFREQADRAHKAGDFPSAAHNLLEASRNLLLLAQETSGGIQEQQLQKARELRDLAIAVGKKKPRTAASDTGGRKKREVESGREPIEGEDASPWLLQKRPGVRLSDVAGLDEVKAVLREKVLDPFLRPEVYRRYRADHGAGVLLYGPPGNGKTFIAKAIAGELDVPFFSADPSQIKDKYVGETAKNLRRLFEEAMSHERSVLFLDEVEALLGRRGNRKVDSVTQFLSLTDGLGTNDSCLLLLCATNKPWALDEAVIRRGRVGTHVYVGLPDAAARSAILRIQLEGVPVDGAVNLDQIGASTSGYSGADMTGICEVAKQRAVNREIASGQEDCITLADLEAALKKVRPGTSDKQLQEFKQWRDRQAGPDWDSDDDD